MIRVSCDAVFGWSAPLMVMELWLQQNNPSLMLRLTFLNEHQGTSSGYDSACPVSTLSIKLRGKLNVEAMLKLY